MVHISHLPLEPPPSEKWLRKPGCPSKLSPEFRLGWTPALPIRQAPLSVEKLSIEDNETAADAAGMARKQQTRTENVFLSRLMEQVVTQTGGPWQAMIHPARSTPPIKLDARAPIWQRVGST